MIPILPSNPTTITPRRWYLNTRADCEARLDQLRKLDTLHRNSDPQREAEKTAINLRLEELLREDIHFQQRPSHD